jgi:hypothetical protein
MLSKNPAQAKRNSRRHSQNRPDSVIRNRSTETSTVPGYLVLRKL